MKSLLCSGSRDVSDGECRADEVGGGGGGGQAGTAELDGGAFYCFFYPQRFNVQFDIFYQVLTKQLQCGTVQSKVAALRWIFHLFIQVFRILVDLREFYLNFSSCIQFLL